MHEDTSPTAAKRATREGAPQPMVDGTPVAAAVDVLTQLAGSGRALELGIGRGRIAIPLAARGVEVHGIDFSEVRLGGRFSLAYVVFNTIMNLTSQAAQVACFRTVAAQLEPGGSFLIETGIPALRLLPPGERYVVFDLSPGHRGIDEYDVANQGLVSHHLEIRGDRALRSSGPFRYVWPSELDLMAEMAGLRLEARWAGWRREPFTSESRHHVSVWRKPA